jgi:two-component system, LytTR family, response regulator
MENFSIPHEQGVCIVLTTDIIRVQGHSNYSKIHFRKGNPLLVAKVLQWFETRLPEAMFARVHRSHLVNRNYVTSIVGKHTAILNNGEAICMSRRKKKQLQLAS